MPLMTRAGRFAGGRTCGSARRGGRARMAQAVLPALGLLLLSACSLVTTAPEPDTPARQAEAARARLAAWQFNGRVHTQEQRASLRWRQQEEAFDLLLRGPFGFGGVRITGTPERVEIDDGEERVVSHDPVLDIYRRTGLLVPLQALRWWALGLPAPDVAATTRRDLSGYISEISQAGWTVSLADYQALDSLVFPHRITLQRDGQLFAIEISRWKRL